MSTSPAMQSKPEPNATLRGHIFYDAAGTGDPTQAALKDVNVAVLDDATGQTLGQGKTGSDGRFEIAMYVPQTASQIRIVLEDGKAIQYASRELKPAAGVVLSPKFSNIIYIPCRAFGELLVKASGIIRGGANKVAGGPTFSVYKGLATAGTPVRQITITEEGGVTLGLAEDQYMIAFTGFALPSLQENFELVSPPNGVSGACVASGQQVIVEFGFQSKTAGAGAAASEVHKILGKVTLQGNPVAGLVIRIEDKTGKFVGQTTSNPDGSYEWAVDAPGDYFVVPVGKRGKPISRLPAVVHSTAIVNISLPPKGAMGRRLRRERFGPGGDPTAYPVLTEEVGWAPSPLAAPSAMPGAPPSGAPIGQAAAKAVSDVLGWKLKADDPNGFVGALTQSFQLTDVEGHVESAWKARTYAVQTDLGGGITGAQASLYSRAKDSLDQSLPLLDGLYPLDPEADPEDVKALRELARSQMTALVQELGALGGPSVPKVNTYFAILLGTAATPPVDADSLADGTLKSLRNVYGIYFKNNPFSNSIEDEQDITNFRIISDYMTSLLQTWINNQQYFTGSGPQAFFGTQLVLISRQLSVVAETVNEVRFVLDSVFIGPAERQTLAIYVADGSVMFFEDILQKIEAFVSDEAPRLLRDGGRLSVTNNVLPVVDMLAGFIQSASEQSTGVPDGYKTVRVQNALDDLSDQLAELFDLASAVRRDLPPTEGVPSPGLTVVSVTPYNVSAKALSAGPVDLMVLGTGFDNTSQCVFNFNVPGVTGPPLSVSSTQFLSSNLLLVKLAKSSSVTIGSYDVVVTNYGTTPPPATLVQGFNVA